jgi:hypothetical protein
MGFYINTDNTIYATTTNGLYNSTDQGETWNLVLNKLPYPMGNKQTEQIAVVAKDRVLIATDNGIYESKDCGLTWSMCYDELLGKRVLRFYRANDGSLYAVLENGLYKYEITTDVSGKETIPSEYSLSQNYPNPFNPETTINYTIPFAGNVRLVVCDALGREVAALVNEYKQAGTYNSKLNTQNLGLSSGVYFYTIQAGEFVQTKKMILIK